jgi:hypothetical protein
MTTSISITPTMASISPETMGGFTYMVDDIAYYLQARGHGTVGVNIFTHRKPPSPPLLVAVFQSTAQGPQHVMSGELVVDWLTLQIQVRAQTVAIAAAIIGPIFAELDGITDVTLGGGRYLGVTAVKSPMPLGGPDEANLTTFYCEFHVARGA